METNIISERRRSYNELIELIELAEKTSEKAASYQNSWQSNIFTTITSLMIFTISISICIKFYIDIDNGRNLSSMSIPFILSFFSIFGISFFIYGMLRVIKIEKTVMVEKKVLYKLIIMIHDMKELVYSSNEISVVEKALIEMRLSRIKFSIKEEMIDKFRQR